jgi:hypothetical protein
MSVMFEILDSLERKDGVAAARFAAKAWSPMQGSPAVEAAVSPSKPLNATPTESVSGDLKVLSQVGLARASGSRLLAIRFGNVEPKNQSPMIETPRTVGREATSDFPSLWAMARLCSNQSPNARRNAPGSLR